MARVRYESIDGEIVSALWYTFLTESRKDGVHSVVNEGKRTMVRQKFFWDCGPSGCCCCNNCNLAARPSPFAPHIRVGRPDHAIDSDEMDDLIRYGSSHGVSIRLTVPGEPWHGEADLMGLERFHEMHKTPPILSDKESKLVARFKYHDAQMKHEAPSGKGPKFLAHRRWKRWYSAKLIVRARLLYRLGKGNFKKHNRGQRRALLLRTVKEA